MDIVHHALAGICLHKHVGTLTLSGHLAIQTHFSNVIADHHVVAHSAITLGLHYVYGLGRQFILDESQTDV
jgi:hypothetical protein